METINIKGFRDEFSYSQEDLASELGVTRNTVANWENGGKMTAATQKRVQKFMMEKLGFEKIHKEESNTLPTINKEVMDPYKIIETLQMSIQNQQALIEMHMADKEKLQKALNDCERSRGILQK